MCTCHSRKVSFRLPPTIRTLRPAPYTSAELAEVGNPKMVTSAIAGTASGGEDPQLSIAVTEHDLRARSSRK
jgi:hypothetical protein